MGRPILAVRIATDISELRRNLLEGKNQIETTTAAMQKLGNSLQGDKLIQTAHNITAAVNELGGAAKLTDAEKQRLNTTLQKAIEKYNVLGKDAPAAMVQLAKETTVANTHTNTWSASLKSLAATMGVTFSVGTVVAFGRELLRMGDEIVRVADRTGLTADEVQRLSYIAKQSGNSIDEFTSSIGRLQDNLGSGNKATLGALKQLNIDFDTLRRASPYQQLELIAEAVKKIPDPARQAQIQVDLFGRSGLTILPSMKAEFKALGDEAPRMSDKTVRALERAGDALDYFALTLKVGVAEAYNYAGGIFDKLMALIFRVGADVNDFAADVLSNIQRVIDKSPGGRAVFGDWTTTIAELRTGASTARTAADLLTKGVDEVAASATRAVAPVANLTETTDKHAETVANLARKLGGQEAISNARAWMDAVTEVGGLERLAIDDHRELSKVLDAALAAYERLGQTAPAAMQKLADSAKLPLESTNLLKGAVGRGPASLSGATANLSEFVSARDLTSGLGTGPAVIGAKTFDASRPSIFSGLSKSVPTAMIDALAGGGSVTKTAAATAGSSIATNVVKKFGSTIESTLGKTFGGAINAVLPGLGTLAAPLMDVVGKLFGKSEESSKVSPVRDEFFKMQGGLETLNPKIQQVTGNLKLVDDVFKAKTVDQYNAAVAAVTTTLEQFEGKLDDARAAQEALADRMGDITAISPDLQAALQAAYDSTNPADYLAAVTNINGILDEQAAQQKFLEDTMKKYGLAWTELGQEAKNAKVAELTRDIVKEFDVLKGAGVDVNHIMEKMGPEVNDLIAEAREAGAEVPESFRRIIQTAIDAGEVFGENGEKITDMKDLGLTFGTTMEQATRDVASAIDRLAEVLETKLGGAFREVSATAQREFRNIPSRIPIEVDYYSEGANLPGNDYDIPGFAGGTRGRYLDFGSGTLAMLHGRERVMTEGEGASGGGGDVTLVINANNSFFDSPSALQRLADKVSEAVSRDVRLRTRYQTV